MPKPCRKVKPGPSTMLSKTHNKEKKKKKGWRIKTIHYCSACQGQDLIPGKRESHFAINSKYRVSIGVCPEKGSIEDALKGKEKRGNIRDSV